MAGYKLPYSRLVDAQHERIRSIAALKRSTTVFFILSLIAAVLAMGIIATLAVYLYFSSQFPVNDSSLPSTAAGGFAQTRTDLEDFAHILKRLNKLEQEVETLKRRCGSSSLRHDKGHNGSEKPDKEHLQPKSATTGQAIDQQTRQESVTRVLQRLMSMTSSIQSENNLISEEESPKSSIQESTVSPHRSASTSPFSTIVGPSPVLEGKAPSVDQQSSSVVMGHAFYEGDLRRVARSRHDKKSTRRSREDVALSTEEPLLRDRGERGDRKADGRGNPGSKDRSSKHRDRGGENSCSQCTAPTTLAAHFEGQRHGNVQITDEAGFINMPRSWSYAEWMTPKDKENFQLSITQQVTVAEGGIYYVYSQIMFYDTNNAVGQSICVNGQPRFTCTKSNISAEAKQSTCFLGGLVHLEAGNQIAIKLSIRNVRIALYPDSSFFGLFKLRP